MAGIDEYSTPTGELRFRVRWRSRMDGTLTRQSMTFPSRKDADTFARMLTVFGGDGSKASAATAGVNTAVKSVHEVMLAYVDANARASAAQLQRYRNQIRDHFSGELGHTPIDQVDTDAIQRWVAQMRAKRVGKSNPRPRKSPVRPVRANRQPAVDQTRTLSPKTIRNLHGLLSASMEWAVTRSLRPDNPCKGVSLPPVEAVGDEMCLMTHTEFELLHDAMSPHYRLLLRTMVGSGLRWGEITALQVADVQKTGGVIALRVNKAWKRDGQAQHYVGATKTRRSRRTVSVGETLGRDLVDLASHRKSTELLFTNVRGTQIRHNTFWESVWTKAVLAAQYPVGPDGEFDENAPRLTKPPRIHDLRHTHASWMINAGSDIMVLQRRLGHESVTTTIDRYSHLMPSQHIESAKVAERAMMTQG